MNKYTIDTTFGEVFNEPVFVGWKHMLDFRRDNPGDWLEGLSFADFQNRMKSTWSARRIMEGYNYLYKCIQRERVFYHYWNDNEREREPSKHLTGLAAFPLEKRSKFVVICPGGGYTTVNALMEGYPQARYLNEMGYAVFVVGYRTGVKDLQPAPQEDLAQAIKYILENAEEFRLDIEDYAVVGFSAGAHLAGSFGIPAIGYSKYCLPKPDAVFLGYPVVSMGENGHAGSRINFFGKEHIDDEVLREKYSIERHVTSNYPKTFLWQCDGDPVVPFINSELLVKALEKNNVHYCYEVFHYPTHGLCDDADEYAKNWLERALKFWEGR